MKEKKSSLLVVFLLFISLVIFSFVFMGFYPVKTTTDSSSCIVEYRSKLFALIPVSIVSDSFYMCYEYSIVQGRPQFNSVARQLEIYPEKIYCLW